MHLSIAQVNTFDICGGAERIALTLHCGYIALGHDSWMVVKQKRSNVSGILEFDENRFSGPAVRFWNRTAGLLTPLAGKVRGASRVSNLIRSFGRPSAFLAKCRGEEDFNYPASQHLLEHLPVDPHIIHCHNLHGGFFDLSSISAVSRAKPLVITLHDSWMFTGHCGHPLNCERWRNGCGECPNLSLPPAIKRDATAFNWNRKQQIAAASRIYLATPSQWLMQDVQQSLLADGIVDSKVVNNGVDLSVFHPVEPNSAREELGLPLDAFILLFAAQNVKTNKFKDYETIRSAADIIGAAKLDRKVVLVALGSSGETEICGNLELRSVPFTASIDVVARYYQAADIYLHAAHLDNFPTTIIEALACGTPVVATAVGGIPEQIEDGITGYLVKESDSRAMANRVLSLIRSEQTLRTMSTAAARSARLRFDQNLMISSYINWYYEILEEWRAVERC